MKLKAILAAVFIFAAGTHAYAANDSLNAVSDFRVTDGYTGLVYGSINSDIMQYKGNDEGITFGGGIHINTSQEFSLNTREDILDSVAAVTQSGNAEFKAVMSVTSCEMLGVTIKNSDAEVIKLWEGTPVEGENTLRIIASGEYVYMSLNEACVTSVKCSGVPYVEIYGKNAVFDICEVSYTEKTENISAAVPDGTVIADIPHGIVLKGENAVKVTKYTADGAYDVTSDYSVIIRSNNFTADGAATNIGKADLEAYVYGPGIDAVLKKSLYVTNDKRICISDAVYSDGKVLITLEGEGKTDSVTLIAAVYGNDGAMYNVKIVKLSDISDGSTIKSVDIKNYPGGGEIKLFLLSPFEKIKPVYTAVKVRNQ